MQDVRKAVLHSLPTAECSLAEILDRTRDVSDEVRARSGARAHSARTHEAAITHHFHGACACFQHGEAACRCGSWHMRPSGTGCLWRSSGAASALQCHHLSKASRAD